MENEIKSTEFSFGQAIEFLKQGKKVARKGWNGKNMFLLLIVGECVKKAIHSCYGNGNCISLDASGCMQGDVVPVLDAIYMKTADAKLVPWLASQTDVLANDWVIVD